MAIPGLPGGAPVPGARKPQVQPVQEMYPQVGMSVQSQEDGSRALVVQVPLPRKVMVFPMTAGQAEEIGAKLAAPSVVRANGFPS